MNVFVCFLILGLGSQSYRVRERYQLALEIYMFAVPCNPFVKYGTTHPDLEISWRCREALRRHHTHGIQAKDLSLFHFSFDFDRDLWAEASRETDSVNFYIRGLLDRYPKWYVIMLISRARKAYLGQSRGDS